MNPDIKRDIPLFDDCDVPDIDEVFESVAWDLCGRKSEPSPGVLLRADRRSVRLV